MVQNPHGSFFANIDYIDEAQYGVTPTNPVLVWIGRVYNAKPLNKNKVATKRYLPDYSETTNRLQKFSHVKIGEEVGLQVDFFPQTGSLLTWLVSFIGGTPGAPVGDTITSRSITLTDQSAATNKYHVYKGMIGAECTLDAPEDGVIDIKSRLIGCELSVGATDPKGSGSHPAASAGAELRTADVSSVQMKYSSGGAMANFTDVVNGFSWKITNTLKLAKDLNNTTSTKAVAIVPVAREMTLTLDIDYSDLGTGSATNFGIADIRSMLPFDIKFVLDSKTYTFSSVKFPELPYAFGPDDIIGDKLTSIAVGGLAVT